MRRLTALLGALFLAGAALVLPAPTAQAAATHQVLMSGYAFTPRTLTITAGDTVTWTNRDQAPHDVRTTSGPAPVHSPMLSKGDSWSHTFTTPGTYGYVCTVHPDMTARLIVKAAPAPAPTVHRHPTSAPPATRPATAMPSSMHMDHTTRAAAPAASKDPSPSLTVSAPATAQPAVDPQDTASAIRPLNPLLLLTGVVAGVAVLCLLLVGSRSAAAASRSDEQGPG
ncbi:cupredoxin family copper-binding protein [Streptomyces coacervatus]|uniref:Cupredoxin family copper-binding protein n=1 Tax=Streptomyces coacervatus TaxID=647381 RepID=A0ABP7JIC1_9ACTN|nr:plastocyanin/azurin family copper-binding protein [Streptomyces coacervatus]MDF2272560.1 plastocyanin/azurin family copper-binding protein [Streptomyces coacervatus]